MLQYNEEELEKMKRIRQQAMDDKSNEGETTYSDTKEGNSTQIGKQMVEVDGDLGLVSRPGFSGGIKGLTNVTGDEEDCVQPAITKFPQPFMGRKVRQYGGVIVHIFVAMYMFVALAIICDDYFVPALDRISEGNYMSLTNTILHFTFLLVNTTGIIPNLITLNFYSITERWYLYQKSYIFYYTNSKFTLM